MKIVQINTVYEQASTGKIAAALYNLANDKGHDARLAYGRGEKPAYYGIDGYLIGNRLDFYAHVLYNFTTGRNGFASKHCTEKFLNWLKAEKPDIIHLHNIHGFYLHVGMLFDFIKENLIPVIWTLHDCWPITGHCAYFDYANCSKWVSGCYDCPIYRSDYPYSIFKDNSRQNWELKKEVFSGVENMTIVTPSKWLAEIVKKSYLGTYPVEVIPNGINTNIFKPYSVTSPEVENIYRCYPHLRNRRVLLGVASIWEERKGLDYLLRLSNTYNANHPDNPYQVVIIGLSNKQCKQISKRHGDNVLCLTRTSDAHELAAWYSLAYAYINPTLQDNYPTTNLEAISCGTPVITFNTGGSPESISEDTGIVVDKYDLKGLVSAVTQIKIPESNTTLRDDFSQETAFQKYIDLYNRIYSANN